jgi:hypothetical protein
VAEEAFQELKWYLTSPLIMVPLKPGEPLLQYIAATTKAVSMVLVTEHPKLLQSQASKGASVSNSGSQDPESPEGPRVGATVGSQLLNAFSGRRCHEPPEPAPMEEHALDPRGGSGPSSAWYTTSVRSSMMPRQETWKCISCFMQFSLHPESYATTSRLTRSRW